MVLLATTRLLVLMKLYCIHECAGYNVCIFCYGQTGSGKTHTMTGTNVDEEDGRGIYFKALDDLFQINHDRGSEVGSSDINLGYHVDNAACGGAYS